MVSFGGLRHRRRDDREDDDDDGVVGFVGYRWLVRLVFCIALATAATVAVSILVRRSRQTPDDVSTTTGATTVDDANGTKRPADVHGGTADGVTFGYPYIPHTDSRESPAQLRILYVNRSRVLAGRTTFAHPTALLDRLADDPSLSPPRPYPPSSGPRSPHEPDHDDEDERPPPPHFLVIDGVEFAGRTVNPSDEPEFDGQMGPLAQASNRRYTAYAARYSDRGRLRDVYLTVCVDRRQLTSRVVARYSAARLQLDLVDYNVSLVFPTQRVAVKPARRGSATASAAANADRPAFANLYDQLNALAGDGFPAFGSLLLASARSTEQERTDFVADFVARQPPAYPLDLYTHWPVETAARQDFVLAILAKEKRRCDHSVGRPQLRIVQRGAINSLAGCRVDVVTLSLSSD